MQALKQTAPFSGDSPFTNFEALRAAYNDGTETEPALFTITNLVTQVANTLANGGVPAPGWTRDDTLDLWAFHTAAKTLSLTPTAAAPADTVDYPATGAANPFPDTAAYMKTVVSGGFTSNALAWKDPLAGNSSQATPIATSAADFYANYLGGYFAAAPHDLLGNVYEGQFNSPNIGQDLRC